MHVCAAYVVNISNSIRFNIENELNVELKAYLDVNAAGMMVVVSQDMRRALRESRAVISMSSCRWRGMQVRLGLCILSFQPCFSRSCS